METLKNANGEQIIPGPFRIAVPFSLNRNGFRNDQLLFSCGISMTRADKIAGRSTGGQTIVPVLLLAIQCW
ncbi:MAG: hypothetical protein CVV32_03035 [Methanomicrobiales archaeon HGW-Methanomicrobiales-3]|jgi:hypothetical protein|nr:MAG: hypothetical protein CVV32_03035 [Methanomicrobiales archaeon HGW-Methanomicrobiales-3]